MIKLNHILFVVGVLVCCACQNTEFNNSKDFHRYINNPKNGYIKTKEHKNITFSMKYLPPEFFIVNEMVDNEIYPDDNTKDSIYNAYSKNRYFLLNISTPEGDNSDVMYIGIGSEEEYRERFEILNFNMDELIYLKTGKNKYFPVLTNLENVYSLSKSRNLNIIFSPGEINDDITESDEYDIVFEDYIFKTGINHFVFSKKDIDKQIKLKFL